MILDCSVIVSTHNSHIFVKPKKLWLFCEMRLFWESWATQCWKTGYLFFRNPPLLKIVTFLLGQNGCDYFEKYDLGIKIRWFYNDSTLKKLSNQIENSTIVEFMICSCTRVFYKLLSFVWILDIPRIYKF